VLYDHVVELPETVIPFWNGPTWIPTSPSLPHTEIIEAGRKIENRLPIVRELKQGVDAGNEPCEHQHGAGVVATVVNETLEHHQITVGAIAAQQSRDESQNSGARRGPRGGHICPIGSPAKVEGTTMESLPELRAREQEVGREWQWLHDALNAVARAKAEQGDAAALRLMQRQAMVVGQRRVELRMKLAALEGPGR